MKKKNKGQKAQEKTRNLLQNLKEQVAAFDDSDFQDSLRFIALNFHRYSFYNTLLIRMQNPFARLCKGFAQWKEHGRYVKAGEKGLQILIPAHRKITEVDESTQEESQRKILSGFFVGYVYDISQTGGEEIPEIERLKIGVEDTDNAIPLFEVLPDVVRSFRLSLEVENTGMMGGYTNGEKVVYAEGANHATAVNTITHELAHALLHYGEDRGTLSKEQKELEAESVSYICSQYFGLPSDAVAYLDTYTKQFDLLDSLGRIHRTAQRIIEAFESQTQTERRTA